MHLATAHNEVASLAVDLESGSESLQAASADATCSKPSALLAVACSMPAGALQATHQGRARAFAMCEPGLQQAGAANQEVVHELGPGLQQVGAASMGSPAYKAFY